MRPFNYFIENKEVRKITPDSAESDALIEDAKNRFDYFSEQVTTEKNAKYILENIYESIRELLDFILIIDGYRSYSHQAPIVYACDKGYLNFKDA
ncbi:MAG: hypothetical protein KKF44_09495 [Nanoarchaeota archaeon]|nr:hypothetical protein [Nanoarchaeota archaeon]